MAAIPRTGHVFISYRQTEPDKQFAHRLAYDLEAAGHPVWIDVQGIEAGQTWNTEIQRALDACYAYVVVLTPEALKSQWVRNELLYALREKAGEIFPVLLIDVKLPPEIIAIQYVDFRHNYGKALTELLANLPVPPSDGGSPSGRHGITLPEEPARRKFPIWMGGLVALVALGLIIGIGALISNGQKAASLTPSPGAESGTGAPTATTAPTDSPTLTPTEAPTATSSAPLGSPGNPIVFDFLADETTSGQVLEYSRTVTDRLSQLTELTIKPKVDIELSQIVGSMCTRTVHMSTLTSLSYLLAKERSCAEVTLVALRSGGSATYVSQIIARSGTPDVKALKGKTFCRIDEKSPSSWIMPKLLLKANGVDPDLDVTLKSLGDAREVVRAIYNNECDGGGTFSDARNDLVPTLPDVIDKVKFLVRTPEIPNDSIAFIPEVPDATRIKITDALIQMAGEKEIADVFRDMNSWTGLKKADDSMYEPFQLLFASTKYRLEDFVE